MTGRGALYVLACGANPAADLHELVEPAMAAGWDVCVGATPSGLDFVDRDGLAGTTGNPVRHTWSGRTSSWPTPSGLIVAPATINTVNKIALGITDTWVVNTVVELWGFGTPTLLAPNVNPWLAAHPRFRRNIDDLRRWGVTVLWEPRDERPWMPAWAEILEQFHRIADP